MKINKKFFSIILLGTIFFMLGIPNKSKAALQSNGGTPTAKDLNSWMLQTRKMQELGGTLGRTDTINTTDLTSEATDLDIHMEKNTEYGAMAILSASAYGNPNKINDGETTTGNSTGVVVNFNNEWTANFVTGNLKCSLKYVNKYIYRSFVAKNGDATLETKGWHGSENDFYYYYAYVGEPTTAFIRAYNGIFSYIERYNTGGLSSINNKYHGRAAIVVGADL